MLAEDSRPKGMAQITASTVPHSAICSVTTISVRYTRHSRKSGGKKLAAYSAMLPESRSRSSGRMSAPRQDAASRASSRPQATSEPQLALGGCGSTGGTTARRACTLMDCSRSGGALQLGQLALDGFQLAGLLLRVHAGVGLELQLLAVQVQH